jgi:hypothetical protein
MNRNSNQDPYRQIFLDLKADLSYLARKHGGRLLEQAARSATQSEVIQRLAEDLTRRTERNDGEPDETFTEETEDDTQSEDTPPEELDYPDEDVWTVPPAPEDEEQEDDEHELSDAAERVLSDLMDSLKDKAA